MMSQPLDRHLLYLRVRVSACEEIVRVNEMAMALLLEISAAATTTMITTWIVAYATTMLAIIFRI